MPRFGQADPQNLFQFGNVPWAAKRDFHRADHPAVGVQEFLGKHRRQNGALLEGSLQPAEHPVEWRAIGAQLRRKEILIDSAVEIGLVHLPIVAAASSSGRIAAGPAGPDSGRIAAATAPHAIERQGEASENAVELGGRGKPL